MLHKFASAGKPRPKSRHPSTLSASLAAVLAAMDAFVESQIKLEETHGLEPSMHMLASLGSRGAQAALAKILTWYSFDYTVVAWGMRAICRLAGYGFHRVPQEQAPGEVVLDTALFEHCIVQCFLTHVTLDVPKDPVVAKAHAGARWRTIEALYYCILVSATMGHNVWRLMARQLCQFLLTDDDDDDDGLHLEECAPGTYPLFLPSQDYMKRRALSILCSGSLMMCKDIGRTTLGKYQEFVMAAAPVGIMMLNRKPLDFEMGALTASLLMNISREVLGHWHLVHRQHDVLGVLLAGVLPVQKSMQDCVDAPGDRAWNVVADYLAALSDMSVSLMTFTISEVLVLAMPFALTCMRQDLHCSRTVGFVVQFFANLDRVAGVHAHIMSVLCEVHVVDLLLDVIAVHVDNVGVIGGLVKALCMSVSSFGTNEALRHCVTFDECCAEFLGEEDEERRRHRADDTMALLPEDRFEEVMRTCTKVFAKYPLNCSVVLQVLACMLRIARAARVRGVEVGNVSVAVLMGCIECVLDTAPTTWTDYDHLQIRLALQCLCTLVSLGNAPGIVMTALHAPMWLGRLLQNEPVEPGALVLLSLLGAQDREAYGAVAKTYCARAVDVAFCSLLGPVCLP